MRWRQVSALGRRLPGVEESRTYGSKALAVRGWVVARLRDDGRSIVVKVDLARRESLCASGSGAFVVTPDVRNYAMVVVRLDAVRPADLWPVLVESWHRSVPPAVAAELGPPEVR